MSFGPHFGNARDFDPNTGLAIFNTLMNVGRWAYNNRVKLSLKFSNPIYATVARYAESMARKVATDHKDGKSLTYFALAHIIYLWINNRRRPSVARVSYTALRITFVYVKRRISSALIKRYPFSKYC